MANTLAYYNTATITAVKSFIVQAQVHNLKNLLDLQFMLRHNKLVRFALAYFYNLFLTLEKG